MGKLTDDQLAQRAATKRNNRLRKSMPLFAELLTETGSMAGWLTTPDAQKDRIRRQHGEFQEHWKKLEQVYFGFKERGDRRRAIVAKHVDADTLDALDKYYQRLFGNLDSQYWADYWWEKLVKYVPAVAQKQCPNMKLHSSFSNWHEECPTCGKPLPRPAAVVADGVKQLSLLEAANA